MFLIRYVQIQAFFLLFYRLLGHLYCKNQFKLVKRKKLKAEAGRTKMMTEEAPTTLIQIFLNPQLFLSGYGFRPHASGEFGSQSRYIRYV